MSTLALFKAIRDDNASAYKAAYAKGARVNVRLDKWIMRGGRQSWGLRVPTYVMNIYTGFSARESWPAPDGASVDRGDTLLMAALKCRRLEAVRWLLSSTNVDVTPRNDAGNSAADLAVFAGLDGLIPRLPAAPATPPEAASAGVVQGYAMPMGGGMGPQPPAYAPEGGVAGGVPNPGVPNPGVPVGAGGGPVMAVAHAVPMGMYVSQPGVPPPTQQQQREQYASVVDPPPPSTFNQAYVYM